MPTSITSRITNPNLQNQWMKTYDGTTKPTDNFKNNVHHITHTVLQDQAKPDVTQTS